MEGQTDIVKPIRPPYIAALLMKKVTLMNNSVEKLLKSVQKKRRYSDLFIVNKFIFNQIGAIYYQLYIRILMSGFASQYPYIQLT